jgi:hypothetical protein
MYKLQHKPKIEVASIYFGSSTSYLLYILVEAYINNYTVTIHMIATLKSAPRG